MSKNPSGFAMNALKTLILGFVTAVASGGWIGEAAAQKRIALVIGNSNYENVRPLANPSRDASAVADMFRKAGFELVKANNDLRGTEMRRVFRDFAEQARTAEIAVVYYAGHGIEIGGTNYLLPVDTVLQRDLDVEDEAISLDRIVRTLEPAKRLKLIILDACRDNPFIRTVRRTNETRSLGRGLAKVEVPTSDTLIAYAAKAGSTAADGDGQHSPFTTALLKNLTVPGLDLRIALGRVRDDVLSATGRQQEPFVYGSLGGTIVSLVPDTKAVAAAPPPNDPNAAVRRDYELAAQVGTRESWDAFLATHRQGFYADLARAQRAKLASDANRIASRTTPSESVTSPAASTPVLTPAPVSPPGTATTNVPQPQQSATVIAALPEKADAEPSKTAADPSETARLMHAELNRVGCYAGDVNASWGANSRRALEQFNTHAKKQLNVRVASLDSLEVLRAAPTRVCPLQCKPGFRAENDTCIKIACPADQTAGADGRCKPLTKPKTEPRTAVRPPSERPAAAGGGARVVCGDTGCFNVPPGCRSEIRPHGNGGNIAVVMCGNR